jgi:hypothetical protein
MNAEKHIGGILFIKIIKVNILANSTWSGLLSYFQGIKIKRFTKW